MASTAGSGMTALFTGLTNVTLLDATHNIVFGHDGTKVALIGVHNLIVVRTDDALLVCDRHDAEKIKQLVGKLPPQLQ
jgi:mannose-1-phosphate guanylyltransferase